MAEPHAQVPAGTAVMRHVAPVPVARPVTAIPVATVAVRATAVVTVTMVTAAAGAVGDGVRQQHDDRGVHTRRVHRACSVAVVCYK